MRPTFQRRTCPLVYISYPFVCNKELLLPQNSEGNNGLFEPRCTYQGRCSYCQVNIKTRASAPIVLTYIQSFCPLRFASFSLFVAPCSPESRRRKSNTNEKEKKYIVLKHTQGALLDTTTPRSFNAATPNSAYVRLIPSTKCDQLYSSVPAL